MSKNNYWQDRFIEEEERLNKIAGDEFRRQQLEYERAIARMNKDIEVWYKRIAKKNLRSSNGRLMNTSNTGKKMESRKTGADNLRTQVQECISKDLKQ